MFHLKLVETLLELHRTQRSCVVRLERGTTKKQLVFSRGALIFAESNLAQEHLAQVLMKLNLLPRKDLHKVSSLMRSGKSCDEAVVLTTGLDDKRLAEGVHEQAVMILASLFAWSACDLRLFDGDGLIRRRCRLALPVPQALVEAARRSVKDRSVPPSCQLGSGLINTDPAAGARASFPLNGAEAYAYAQVEGATPISHLLPMLPPGEAKPEELLQRLLLLGLLRLEAAMPERSSSAGGAQQEQLSEQVDELLRRFEVANLYEILSLPSDAREADIKTAYHEMARLYHPDRFESKEYSSDFRTRVEKLFTYITGAYTTLSDTVARANYDETRMKKESQVEATLQGRAAVDSDKEKMAETLFRAGRTSLKNREFEKAVSQLRECVWLRPDTARYHHLLGVAQVEIAALRKEAEQHLLKAIELEHMNPDTYLQLGKLYLKVNLPKRAEAQFLEVLHWDPENSEALNMLQALDKNK
ncbi:MAG: DnaJ domain-containing protein [Acidobacteriia bacterium]|nr:DnaJ domain-containing protein [Terriglobia bacterium]